MTLSDIIQTEDWYVIPRDNGGAYLIQKTRTEPNWKAIDASGGTIFCTCEPQGIAHKIALGSAYNRYLSSLGGGSSDPGYNISPVSDNLVRYDNLAEEDYLLAQFNGTLLDSLFVRRILENYSPRSGFQGNLELAHPVKYNALIAGKIALGFGALIGFPTLLLYVFGSGASMILTGFLPALMMSKTMGRTR